MGLLSRDYLVKTSANFEDWCSRYNLQPEESECLDCGERLVANVPAFSKNWRGLVADPCPCGSETVFKVVVFTADGDLPHLVKVLLL